MSFSDITKKQRVLLTVNTVAMQFTTVVSFSVMWDLTQNGSWDNLNTWHVFLCTMGYGTLMTKALMDFNEYNVTSLGTNRIERGKNHAIVMGLGCLLVTIGIALKICQKSHHFTSVHGKLGITAWIVSLLAMMGGILSKYISFGKPVIFKFCHNFLGICGFLIGIVALGYGIKQYLGYNSGASTSMIVMMSLYTTYALRPPALSLINQARDLAA